MIQTLRKSTRHFFTFGILRKRSVCLVNYSGCIFNNILSIHFLMLIQFRAVVGVSLSHICWEAGYTLNRSPVYRRANTQRQTTTHMTYGQIRSGSYLTAGFSLSILCKAGWSTCWGITIPCSEASRGAQQRFSWLSHWNFYLTLIFSFLVILWLFPFSICSPAHA